MSNVVNARVDRMVYTFDGQTLSLQRLSRLRSFLYQAKLIGESLSSSKAGDFPSDQIRGHVTLPLRLPPIPKTAQWLGGIGEGAWYAIEPTAEDGRQFKVTRYDAKGVVLYSARYTADRDWQPSANYKMTFNTEYRFVTVEQLGVTIRLSLVSQENTAQNNHAFAI